ncbi:MAG: tRNA pseudouridine(38-40) synthase TruA [Lachnospiraceae bacterium]
MEDINIRENENMESPRPRRRIMLSVAYDGTNYHGWQIQPESITIEGVLNSCLTDLLGEEIQVIGASRTDAGVHALGNIAVFDTHARIPAEKMPYACNQRLPEDIRIQHAWEVPLDFHPRKCESRKTYEYRILNTKFQIPNKRLYCHWTYLPLDEAKMQEAANVLVGEHDFTSFCSIYSQAEDHVRTIYDCRVFREGENEIVIRITGSGFLYNMVRIIAGTLMEAGQGKRDAENMKATLEAKDRTKAGPTAPAKGLTLYHYEFVPDCPDA